MTGKIIKNNYDSAWKETLIAYFRQFLELCRPEIAQEVDWTKQPESLDKEFRAVCPEAEDGEREADVLLKVWLKNGDSIWVLLHVEIQMDARPTFQERMYIYRYRLSDRYKRPVYSLAILGDDNPNWRPNCYQESLWDSNLTLNFSVIKLLDYVDQKADLEAMGNPFATVILAHLEALTLKGCDGETRLSTKFALTKRLFKKGRPKEDIRNLCLFIDWLITLPPPLALQYREMVYKFEQEQHMPYISTFERIGIEKGLAQGLSQGIISGESKILTLQLEQRFGTIPDLYQQKLVTATDAQLTTWAKQILTATHIADVFCDDE